MVIPLADGESLVKEAANGHFLRPASGLSGRLCHSYLTDRRLVLCAAYYDLAAMREKEPGPVLYEAALSSIVRLKAGPPDQEPCLLLTVALPDKAPETLLLFFRDDSWTAAAPERLAERDEWLAETARCCSAQGGTFELVAPKTPEKPVPAGPAAPVKPAGWLAGKYELKRELGSGGMGIVYEGRDHSLDRPVAIKRMLPALKLAGRDKTLFLKEAKLSASLHHPFIADIYAILDEGAELYLIFEYVDGKTLQEYLDTKRVMPAEKAKPVLKCICEALAYAHSCKVVHRDIKPSNIMLTKHGYAKVMDFGVARQIKDTAERLSKTKLDTSGTLAYMAPEQERGRSDLRADIFALGATVYELLGGEQPFTGPNFYIQKEKQDFKPLADLEPSVPPELSRAVERCMSFKAEDRFQSVAEFAKAIGAA
ncbi:MAG: serine/threonine-protein kinase [Elusimicrobiota bacterium]